MSPAGSLCREGCESQNQRVAGVGRTFGDDPVLLKQGHPELVEEHPWIEEPCSHTGAWLAQHSRTMGAYANALGWGISWGDGSCLSKQLDTHFLLSEALQVYCQGVPVQGFGPERLVLITSPWTCTL